MRIRKFIDIQREVELDLSPDDIAVILDGSESSERAVLRGLNDFATFIKGISDDRVKNMSVTQKKAIHKFLFDQSVRFAPKIDRV